MTAISRNRVNIYITSADTAISSLTATDIWKGDIKSYSKSGGETDVESEAVFGGFVDIENPTTQVELSFEIIPQLESGVVSRWDKLAYSEDVTNAGVYTMASETSKLPGDKMVVLEALKGTETYKTIAFNNCKVTVLDMEHNADENRTYNMTMKFSPTNPDGVSNFMSAAKKLSEMPAWTALDNNTP
jgi:hypothetical protein